MNSKQLFAAAAFALIGSTSFAQEATSDAWMNVSSIKSTAQVAAELAQAKQDGSIKASSAGYTNPVGVSKTRAEVMAETVAARRSGELDAINSEVYAFNAGGTQAAVRLAQASK